MALNTGDFWIADDVIAHVDHGEVTINIQRPIRSLPKERAENVANKNWLETQLHELNLAKKQRNTIDIPLTDRSIRSSLRLGGGFVIIQGTRIILLRRDRNAPRRACQLCECGGIYEVVDPDPYHPSNDYIASLLKESAEVVMVCGNRVYVPEFSISSTSLAFQPPGLQIEDYNEIVFDEFKKEITSSKLPVTISNPEFLKFHASILNYENSVKLQFADSPTISVDFTAELDTSSLEFVGVLSYPDDVDLAAIAYLEGRSNNTESEKETLRVLKNEKENNNQIKPIIEYWDTECQNVKPLNRDILLINFMDRKTHVWNTPKEDSTGRTIAPDSMNRGRIITESDLGSELSRTHLAETSGRHATEKAEKAIKMHCPLPLLQPLITL